MIRRPQSLLLGGLAVLAFSSGCSLALDFRSSPVPFDEMACNDAEPNETPETAVMINEGVGDLGLCPSTDRDYYRFEALAGRTITAEIEYDPDGGSLALELLGPGGLLIARADGGEGMQVIERSPALGNELPAGPHLLQILPRDGNPLQQLYTLRLNIQ